MAAPLIFPNARNKKGTRRFQSFLTFTDTIVKNPDDIFTLNPWGDKMFHVEQVPCWITYTNPKTHDIIRENLHQSPMYSGKIEGVGPRYCPSIEDKVVKVCRERTSSDFP